MKILALEREKPNLSAEMIEPHLASEARTVWELMQAGYIREIYFTQEDHTAVIMLEADDSVKAHELLGKLPLVREGFIEFEIIPLVPYSGFERLFLTANT